MAILRPDRCAGGILGLHLGLCERKLHGCRRVGGESRYGKHCHGATATPGRTTSAELGHVAQGTQAVTVQVVQRVVTEVQATSAQEQQRQQDQLAQMASAHRQTQECAFAVVVDLLQTDLARRIAADRFKATGQKGGTFETLLSGLVPGDQTNNRAELLAALVAIQTNVSCEIITDSTYVIHMINAVSPNPNPALFWGAKSFDI